MRLRACQYFERHSMEGVASQNSCGVIERAVHSWLAAPHVVVIHARQVVMHERVYMDGLNSRSNAHRDRTINMKQSSRRGDQQRAKPLASAYRRVSHGGI
jgi:hypothetical protein